MSPARTTSSRYTKLGLTPLKASKIRLPQCYRELVYRWLSLELARQFGDEADEKALVKAVESDYDAVWARCVKMGLGLTPVFCDKLIVFALVDVKADKMIAALRTERSKDDAEFVRQLIDVLVNA